LQVTAQNRNWALGAISGMRAGRNGGYALYYYNPPIYQGQNWTMAPRPYYVSSWEARRVITSLTNNGKYISRITSW
jgi:hypothetical protein